MRPFLLIILLACFVPSLFLIFMWYSLRTLLDLLLSWLFQMWIFIKILTVTAFKAWLDIWHGRK